MAQLILDQAKMPIAQEMDNLSVHADALRDWWGSDQGRNATNLLKATIRLRMMELDGAAVTKMQSDQQNAMAAQAPMMEMQAAQQQAQQQAESEQAAAQQGSDAAAREEEQASKEMDMEAKAAEKLMDAEQKDKEMAFQAQEADKQRAHELEIAKMSKSEKKAK